MAQARTPLTKDQIEAFTAGDCWVLAREMVKLGLGEAVFLSTMTGDYKPSTFPWDHVVVRLPSGLYLDATGVKTLDELTEDWSYGSEPLNTLTVTSDGDYALAVAEQRRFYRHNARSAALKLQKMLEAA